MKNVLPLPPHFQIPTFFSGTFSSLTAVNFACFISWRERVRILEISNISASTRIKCTFECNFVEKMYFEFDYKQEHPFQIEMRYFYEDYYSFKECT